MPSISGSLKKKLFLAYVILFLNSTFFLQASENKNHLSILDKKNFSSSFKLERQKVFKQLKFFTSKAHPFGSLQQEKIASWLIRESKKEGLFSYAQHFVSRVPRIQYSENKKQSNLYTKTLKGRNVISFISNSKEAKCYYILASHYDTKKIEGFTYLGANDSASSSILLLQLAIYLKKNKETLSHLPCDFLAIWFDGEESVLENWFDGENSHPLKIKDNTYGSRYFASKLRACKNKFCFAYPSKHKLKPVESVILLDMLGSPKLKISHESFSSKELKESLKSSAKSLNYQKYLSGHSLGIEDDHLPFLKLGIPSLNIIDFDNLDHWHKKTDILDKVSISSMQIAGQLALFTSLDFSEKK